MEKVILMMRFVYDKMIISEEIMSLQISLFGLLFIFLVV